LNFLKFEFQTTGKNDLVKNRKLKILTIFSRKMVKDCSILLLGGDNYMRLIN